MAEDRQWPPVRADRTEADGPPGRIGRDNAGSGRFAENNRVSTKHGGDGALLRLGRGLPLVGMGAEIELVVRAELEEGGTRALLADEVVRIATVSRLFYRAFLTAEAAGDLKLIERYAGRSGYLANATVQCLSKLAELEEKQSRGDYASVIAQIEEDAHGT